MKRVAPAIGLLLIFLCRMVSALEAPTKEQIEEYRSDGSLASRIAEAKALGNHLTSESLVARAQHRLRRISLQRDGMSPSEIDQILAPPPAWRGMPTSGTVKVLALLIAFSDYPETDVGVDSAATIASKLFGNGTIGPPYESLRNYYQRSSYNKLEIQGNVLGWYRTSYPRGNVPQTTQGRQNLIKEALNYYEGLGHDFAQYDNDGDGTIDYLIVIWTGPHGAWASFWWGYMTTFSDSSYRLDGKRLDTYSWQWAAYNYPGPFSSTVAIHETGHALGLPDYYDYDGSVGPDGGVGGLDMMDANRGDHNCFSKFLLDWINPTVHKSGLQNLTLNPSATSEDALVVMPGALQGNQFAEFFMIQNRYRAANDTPYPNDGLLIWHVDARLNASGTNFLYNNSYAEHKLLRLMEADGLEEIEAGGSADAADYYTTGKTFSSYTTPGSQRYNETATGVDVRNISAAGNAVSFAVSIPNRSVDFDMDGETDIAIYRASNGAWYIYPSGDSPPYGVGWGGDSYIPSAGDYDGDGKTDIAVYDTTTGVWWIIPSSGTGAYGVGWGGPGFTPVHADYDGDAKTDIAIYDTTAGAWWIIPSSGAGAYGVGWGGSAFKPAPADYDGDGKTDIAIYDSSSGAWWIIPSSGGGAYGVDWGGFGFTPVPGDYDGDGKADVAIYRTSNGGWYIIPSSAPDTPYGVGWGGDASDKPVSGDYDGDGKTDIAIYRTSTGGWYIVPSSGGSPYGVGWGGDGIDLPVTTIPASVM